jgi:hypothetical protein
MSDPVGTVGTPPHRQVEFADLESALKGGDDFSARIKEIHAARVAHEAAFAELRIGNDARAALDRAARLMDEAAAARTAAKAAVANAKKEAAEITSRVRRDESAAQAAREEAEATLTRAQTAEREAVAAKQRAEQIQKDFSGKIARLNELLREMGQ